LKKQPLNNQPIRVSVLSMLHGNRYFGIGDSQTLFKTMLIMAKSDHRSQEKAWLSH